VKSDNADVFFPGALLWFDESSGSINTHNEASCDFGIECAGMTGFLDSEDTFEPGDNFVGWGVGWFVEVDHAGSIQLSGEDSLRSINDDPLDVCLEISLEWADSLHAWLSAKNTGK